MGFSVSFVALRGIDKAQVLERLGAMEGDEVEYAFAAPLQWVTLSSWVIVTSNNADLFSPKKVQELSLGGEAVGCWVVDGSMGSDAYAFRDGVQVWKLSYDCDAAKHSVTVEGDPPAAFAEIERRAQEEQATGHQDVDYIYDVPSNVFAALTGFRHDEDVAEPFYELKAPGLKGSRGGLFALLAGLFRRG